jgi:hypothetical protein
MAVLRQGRQRTEGLHSLYMQVGDEPSDADVCVGMVSTPDMAKIIVRAVNEDETFQRLVEL